MILFIVAASMLQAPTNSAELAEVESVYKLAQSTLLECMLNKAVELDDGKESAPVIARATLTSCHESRKKALFLGSWKRMLTSKDKGPKLIEFASAVQEGIDRKFEEDAVLQILENRAKKNASNK